MPYTFTVSGDLDIKKKLNQTPLKVRIEWSCKSGTMCENSNDKEVEDIALYVKFATGNLSCRCYKFIL